MTDTLIHHLTLSYQSRFGATPGNRSYPQNVEVLSGNLVTIIIHMLGGNLIPSIINLTHLSWSTKESSPVNSVDEGPSESYHFVTAVLSIKSMEKYFKNFVLFNLSD